jgi:hypothetical protein
MGYAAGEKLHGFAPLLLEPLQGPFSILVLLPKPGKQEADVMSRPEFEAKDLRNPCWNSEWCKFCNKGVFLGRGSKNNQFQPSKEKSQSSVRPVLRILERWLCKTECDETLFALAACDFAPA